ncbi:LptE family protein [Rhodocaloribacter litoris]|uniref:LptE family protein n=1 Tax=Rhodocaloribacter litoris TaxID=2558931 RepID=UPI001E29ED9B|nr:LptE family protein [Rhodocaloribacter litoris]
MNEAMRTGWIRRKVVWLLALLPVGCAYYSFSGATIPSHLHTIAIPLAEDRSVSPVTALDERLTRLLVDRFVGQTRLSLEPDPEAADAVLFVTIDRYQNEPTAVGGQERTTRNRVTLSVTARYVDRTEERELLRRSFQGFEEYDPVAQGLAGEETAAFAALEKIADDIFTAATSNW